MKKVISIVMATFVMLGISVFNSENVSANENNIDETINIMDTGDFGEYTVKEISESEYVKRVAENENISLKRAQEKVSKETFSSGSILARAAGSVVYRDASWTQTYSKNSTYKARLNATFAVYVSSSSSFREIKSFTTGSSLAAGASSAQWNVSHYDPKPSLPKTSVSLGVTGSFAVTRSTSGGGSVSIPGFSVSSSTSSSRYYVSQNMTIRKTYSVY